MGTDVHGVFQKKNSNGGWEDIPHKWEMNRHYQLFAVLANVRNGTGFAGVPTGTVVTPIAEPRGYPEDFPVENDTHVLNSLDHMDPHRRRYAEEYYDPKELWMGDHSHTWLTGQEMLEWYATAPTVTHCGYITLDVFRTWDKVSEPSEHCGGVWGGRVFVISEAEATKHVNSTAFLEAMDTADREVYVSVSWPASLRSELAYFFDEVKRLVAEHGEIRLVIGFDS